MSCLRMSLCAPLGAGTSVVDGVDEVVGKGFRSDVLHHHVGVLLDDRLTHKDFRSSNYQIKQDSV